MALPGGEMMPREIKFRGMDLKGNWYYGNVSVLPDKVHDVAAGTYISNIAGCPFAYAVRPETVGQYIGRKAKGKEVYEGDIVNVSMAYKGETLPHRGGIVYNNTFGAFATKNLGGVTLLSNHCLHTIEVIGNIHENPELLK